MFNNDILTIDFGEFDKVVAREVVASKSETPDEFDDQGFEIDMSGSTEPTEAPLDPENYEPNETDPEKIEDLPESKKEPEAEKLEETEDALPEEDKIVEETPIDESTKPAKNVSIFEIYTRKSQKKNKIVESLLVDNTVDTIERIVTSTLKACGISKAEAKVVIGLMLDRMLHASDDDVAAPDFLDCTLGDLIDNKDVANIIKKAVVDALSGVDNPGIETMWDGNNGKEPAVESAEAVNSAK